MSGGAPQLVLCWPGRTTAEYARIGVTEYLGRIRRFRTCECFVVPEEPVGKKYSEAHRVGREGKSILKRLATLESTYLVVVDPVGKHLTSAGFARLLERQCYDSARTLTFVVGGPDGIAPIVKDQADMLLGLSQMTLPHDMARLLLVEQLYRGLTIIRGLPYDR